MSYCVNREKQDNVQVKSNASLELTYESSYISKHGTS